MNNKKLTCHVECEQFIILGGEGERGEGGGRERERKKIVKAGPRQNKQPQQQKR